MSQLTLPSGVTIEYERHGSGEPLLLVMGLAGQLIDWPEGFIAELTSAGFEVIVFDNRDSGLSTEFDWNAPSQATSLRAMLTRRPLKRIGYTIDDMAADAAGLLTELEIPSADVVGMSMGGMIAQAMAIRFPQQVRSLTSVMSHTGDRRNGGVSWKLVRRYGFPSRPDRERAADEAVRLWQHISGDHFDEAETRQRSNASVARSWRPNGVSRQTAAIAGSPDRTPGLRTITTPTLVIHGLKDLLVTPSGGHATAAAVRHSRLLMFPTMGHNLPAALHQEIAGSIANHVERVA